MTCRTGKHKYISHGHEDRSEALVLPKKKKMQRHRNLFLKVDIVEYWAHCENVFMGQWKKLVSVQVWHWIDSGLIRSPLECWWLTSFSFVCCFHSVVTYVAHGLLWCEIKAQVSPDSAHCWFYWEKFKHELKTYFLKLGWIIPFLLLSTPNFCGGGVLVGELASRALAGWCAYMRSRVQK